jgi:hypothetical protein
VAKRKIVSGISELVASVTDRTINEIRRNKNRRLSIEFC